MGKHRSVDKREATVRRVRGMEGLGKQFRMVLKVFGSDSLDQQVDPILPAAPCGPATRALQNAPPPPHLHAVKNKAMKHTR